MASTTGGFFTDTKNLYILIIIGVVASGIVGYYIGAAPINGLNLKISSQNKTILTLTTVKNDLENQVSNLDNQVSSLQVEANKVPGLLQQINNLSYDKTILTNKVASLISQMDYFQSEKISDLQIINDLKNQVNDLKNQVNDLKNQGGSQQSTIDQLNSQINQLQQQIDLLVAAKLVKINIVYTDSRPLFGTPYITVSGNICNVGSNTAYNCKLHVVAYQSAVTAIDTYINLPYMAGEGWVSVNSPIYYNGSPITSVYITPQWEN